MPHNVKGVVAKPGKKPGAIGQIFYITQGDIAHIRQRHGKDFASLSDTQLTALLMTLLKSHASATEYNTKDDSTVYYYDDVMINGRLQEIAIAISNSKNRGKVNTSFIPDERNR